MTPRPVSWFLSRLQNVEYKRPGEFFAKCPCHEDVRSSLHISESIDENGDPVALLHCFAGCTYSEIVHSLEEGEESVDLQIDLVSLPSSSTRAPQLLPIVNPGLQKSQNTVGRDWWSGYTGIPYEWWESQGVEFEGDRIFFSWGHTPSRKVRMPNIINQKTNQWDKIFFWEGPKRIPLWPDFPKEMPDTIFLSEGESDWGVYAYLGLPVWSVMQGVASKIDIEIFRGLFDRGVRRIILGFDDDNVGHKGANQLQGILRDCGLRSYVLPLTTLRDPLLYEKDIRDVWFRYLQKYGEGEASIRLKFEIDRLVRRLLETPASGGRVSVSQLLRMPTSPTRWLVDQKWLDASYGVFAGPPKIGKSIITLDLAISVATGTPFMGRFPISHPGPVFLIGKEDSEMSLQDRTRKMMNARGFFDISESEGELSIPNLDNIPLIYDLSREFYLSDGHVTDLINWTLQTSRLFGYDGPRLIILDPLLRLIEGVDLFNAGEVNDRVISPLKKIRDATGASVMLVHHTKKESKDTPTFDGWYGSMALFASSESFATVPSRAEDANGFRSILFGTKDSEVLTYQYRPVFEPESLYVECEEDTALVI